MKYSPNVIFSYRIHTEKGLQYFFTWHGVDRFLLDSKIKKSDVKIEKWNSKNGDWELSQKSKKIRNCY